MQRWRVAAAAVVAVVVLVSCVVAFQLRRDDAADAVAATPTTRPATTTTTEPKPVHAFEAADAVVPGVALHTSPTEPAFDSLPNPTIEGVPLGFLVKAHGPPGWLQVQISRRPNETTAWIKASDVAVRGVDNRIVVEVAARQLSVFRGLSDEVLFRGPVAVGTPRTPTPLGHFFVDAVVQLTRPTGVYGPYQLSVAGFSDVLLTFEGGPGQIAIHGTNRPDLIGGEVSNGCVRMTNDDITAVAGLAPLGTPVEIVA